MKYTNVAYVGIDWASATHYAYALDASGQKLGHRSFPHSGEGLVELANWIRSVTNLEPGSVAIGIEVPHGPVVEHLMDAGFLVHAVNPKQLDRLRDRFTMAGAKDDRLDAFVLADSMRTDLRFYRFLEPVHPTIIELREWSRMVEDLSAERNRLANRFRHQLWRYFPQIVDLSEDWARDWILDLWELIPTPAKARGARTSTVARLLQRCRVRKWSAESLLVHLRAPPIAVAPGVTEAPLPNHHRTPSSGDGADEGWHETTRTAVFRGGRSSFGRASRARYPMRPRHPALAARGGADRARCAAFGKPRRYPAAGCGGASSAIRRRSRDAAQRQAVYGSDAPVLPASAPNGRLSLGEGRGDARLPFPEPIQCHAPARPFSCPRATFGRKPPNRRRLRHASNRGTVRQGPSTSGSA